MNNKHTAKGILVLLVLAVGYFLGSVFGSEDVFIEVDNETKWCFYADYEDAGDYDVTQRPQTSFISIKGSKYRVFAHCETFDWYAKAKGQ